jgi:hypothetical protein
MALSVSILFFFISTVSLSLWVRVHYQRELISKRRTYLLIQAFRPPGAQPTRQL